LAISWIAALKVIPWGDVMEAAPHIVKGAKHLFTSSRNDIPGATSGTENIDTRLQRLQAHLAEIEAEQQKSATLIKSLAEQNIRVVEAIEIMRVRTKILMYVSIAMASTILAMGVWIAVK